MSVRSINDAAMPLSVAVIGAGFSGIAVARQLLKDGCEDFLVFDRASSIGGTWRDNTYPGCACDIPAVLYSYSFAPNPDWSSTYATQAEFLDYLTDCCTKFGVDPYLRLDHELKDAAWDERNQHWQVKTSRGRYTAKTLVVATGYLSEPNIPSLEGIESFQGKAFHTANWDGEFGLQGKRVAVIGSGASAIQVVPAIQPDVAQLDLYQRTAPWVTPKHQQEIGSRQRWAIRHIPGFQKLLRNFTKWEFESLAFALRRPFMMKQIQKFWGHNLERFIEKPELRARLKPDFIMGCKRILFSDAYYPALNNTNVELVNSGIRRVTATGIEANDGTHRPVDAIIYGTGFRATDLPIASVLRGKEGQKLDDVWKDGQVAYLGSSVAGFPNMFMMLGPGTTLTHTSMSLMIEYQASYIGDYLRKMRKLNISSVDVKAKKMNSFRDRLDRYVKGTVWSSAGGCISWYQDVKGRNTTVWPTYAVVFKLMTWRFSTRGFDVKLMEKKANPAKRVEIQKV